MTEFVDIPIFPDTDLLIAAGVPDAGNNNNAQGYSFVIGLFNVRLYQQYVSQPSELTFTYRGADKLRGLAALSVISRHMNIELLADDGGSDTLDVTSSIGRFRARLGDAPGLKLTFSASSTMGNKKIRLSIVGAPTYCVATTATARTKHFQTTPPFGTTILKAGYSSYQQTTSLVPDRFEGDSGVIQVKSLVVANSSLFSDLDATVISGTADSYYGALMNDSVPFIPKVVMGGAYYYEVTLPHIPDGTTVEVKVLMLKSESEEFKVHKTSWTGTQLMLHDGSSFGSAVLRRFDGSVWQPTGHTVAPPDTIPTFTYSGFTIGNQGGLLEYMGFGSTGINTIGAPPTNKPDGWPNVIKFLYAHRSARSLNLAITFDSTPPTFSGVKIGGLVLANRGQDASKTTPTNVEYTLDHYAHSPDDILAALNGATELEILT